MSGTSIGARATAAKLLAADPNYFKNLSKRAQKPRGGLNSVGSFKTGEERAKEAGQRGGQTSRRTPAKTQRSVTEQDKVSRVELDYTNYEQEQ